MSLTRLQLDSYRNHRNLDMTFQLEKGITFLIGNNAKGKTNILEAVYLLALTKSFREAGTSNLICWGTEYARIKGTVVDINPEIDTGEKDRTELEVFLGLPPNPQRSLKINQIKVSAEQFIGNFNVVLFHPEDLNMLYLGPDLRRKYLDVMNIQVSKVYFRALRQYKKLLEQRNSLLKLIRENLAGVSQLDVWDEQFAIAAAQIIASRAKNCDYLGSQLVNKYQSISGTSDVAELTYDNPFSERLDSGDLLNTSLDKLGELFLGRLHETRARDIQAGITTVGPHRDDLTFTLRGRELSTHASRGEYRSLLLALKLIEVDFYTIMANKNPVLLLDDVFSELDDVRKKMLVHTISNYQTIITTTQIDDQRLHEPDKIDGVYLVDDSGVNKSN